MREGLTLRILGGASFSLIFLSFAFLYCVSTTEARLSHFKNKRVKPDVYRVRCKH